VLWHQQYKTAAVVVKGFTTFFTPGKANDQSEDRGLGTGDVFRGRSPADLGQNISEQGHNYIYDFSL